MHGGHHGLSEQDLLNLHNATLPAIDDGQVKENADFFFSFNVSNNVFLTNFLLYFPLANLSISYASSLSAAHIF